MKKMIALMVMAMVSATAVSALDFPGGWVGYANDMCTDRGFDHAITHWAYDWENDVWVVDSENGFAQEGTSVSGTRYSFDWDVGASSAAGIAVKIPGHDVEKVEFGSSGHFSYDGEHDGEFGPSDVVFCGNNTEEVPEFSTIAAGLALSGAGAAFLMLRKRH